MALYGDLTFDSRVRREARTLVDAGYQVTIVCLGANRSTDGLLDDVRVVTHRPALTPVLPRTTNPFFAPGRGRLAALGARGSWLRGYVANLRSWGRAAVDLCGPVDIWHAHDLTGLAAIGPVVGSRQPIVYDAHELFLETGTALRLPRPLRALLRAYERRLLGRVAAVLTVNEALAGVLRTRYHPPRLEVVRNCPARWIPPATRPRLIQEATAIPDGAPVVLYHGALGPHRGIEHLMDALRAPGLENAHLALLGFGPLRDAYQRTAGEPRSGGRVHVLDPVPPDELLAWVASADVGAVLIERSTLNHYLSTPNKLFECLAAGIPVVASDFPAIREVVLRDPAEPLGPLCDPADVAQIAASLRSIVTLDASAAATIRARCSTAAQQRWNWETESVALTRLYTDLLRSS